MTQGFQNSQCVLLEFNAFHVVNSFDDYNWLWNNFIFKLVPFSRCYKNNNIIFTFMCRLTASATKLCDNADLFYDHYVHVDGVRLSLSSGHQRTCSSSHRWYMSMESLGGRIWTEKARGTQRKPFPSATLSNTYLKWTDLGANPGLLDERLAANRLSHGLAFLLSAHYSLRVQYPW
jgi:hypothetical protein